MLTQRARQLRNNLTAAEQLLWRHLRQRQVAGYKFRRQQLIGRYIVDFVSLEKELIVEVDGGQHAKQISHDLKRTEWLKSRGYRMLRFWDNEVIENLEGVVQTIVNALTPPPFSSPSRGEETNGWRFKARLAQLVSAPR